MTDEQPDETVPVAAQDPAPDAPVPTPDPSPVAAEPAGTEPQDTPTPETTPEPEPGPAVVSPIFVDGKTRRDDNDALEGQFCKIISGPDEGRVGVFDSVATYDPETGYPTRIIVRTRDAQNELLSVDYAAVRPTPDYAGGR